MRQIVRSGILRASVAGRLNRGMTGSELCRNGHPQQHRRTARQRDDRRLDRTAFRRAGVRMGIITGKRRYHVVRYGTDTGH